jgi:hypothetical protein
MRLSCSAAEALTPSAAPPRSAQIGHACQKNIPQGAIQPTDSPFSRDSSALYLSFRQVAVSRLPGSGRLVNAVDFALDFLLDRLADFDDETSSSIKFNPQTIYPPQWLDQ